MMPCFSRMRTPTSAMHLFSHNAFHKATTTPKNPTAPRTPAAMTPVGAAPALLELEGAAELEACVVATEVVVALLVVIIVLLEDDVVIADVVAGAVPVPPPLGVKPAPISSETSSGMMVAATPAILMTQDCASGARVLHHAGKPLSWLIWYSNAETAVGFPRIAVTDDGIPNSLRIERSVWFVISPQLVKYMVRDLVGNSSKT